MLKSVKITYFEITFSETFSLLILASGSKLFLCSDPEWCLHSLRSFPIKIEMKQNRLKNLLVSFLHSIFLFVFYYSSREMNIRELRYKFKPYISKNKIKSFASKKWNSSHQNIDRQIIRKCVARGREFS